MDKTKDKRKEKMRKRKREERKINEDAKKNGTTHTTVFLK